MMYTLETVVEWMFSGLVQNFIWVIVGILFANVIRDQWNRRKYGRWRVILMRSGREIVNRKISPGKALEILEETSELDDFLKGVVSPYAWINCDIIEEGEKLGLLPIDYSSRVFEINLDKNPRRKTPGCG